MIQDIKRGPHMDDCPGVGCGGAVRTIESFEASEVSRNLITEMRERIAQLEAARDALAAAVIATPMPSIIENTEPFAQVPADSLLKLEWRAGRVYEWWATREGDVEFARRILAARDKEKDEKIAALAAALDRIVTHSRDADCGDHCSNFCMYCQGRAALAALETPRTNPVQEEADRG